MFNHSKLCGRTTRTRSKIMLPRRAVLRGLIGLGAVAAFGGIEAVTKTGFFESGTALADFSYNGQIAAQWADTYAISSGTDYASQTQGGVDLEAWSLWTFWKGGDDCTNFVSNSILQGGFSPDGQWYCNSASDDGSSGYNPWSLTITLGTTTQQLNTSSSNGYGYHPWSVPGDLLYYMQSMGYGNIVNKFVGPQRGKNNTNGAAQGDLVFFSWKNDSHIDHVAIQTVGLLDSNGYTTYDQVDAHSADLLQAFWTLEDFWADDSSDIPDPNNVAIYVMHITSNTAPALYVPLY